MTTLPVAVSLKRFLAPLFVFILGIFVFLQIVESASRDGWACPFSSAVAVGAQECGLVQRRRGKGKARPPVNRSLSPGGAVWPPATEVFAMAVDPAHHHRFRAAGPARRAQSRRRARHHRALAFHRRKFRRRHPVALRRQHHALYQLRASDPRRSLRLDAGACIGVGRQRHHRHALRRDGDRDGGLRKCWPTVRPCWWNGRPERKASPAAGSVPEPADAVDQPGQAEQGPEVFRRRQRHRGRGAADDRPGNLTRDPRRQRQNERQRRQHERAREQRRDAEDDGEAAEDRRLPMRRGRQPWWRP